MNGFIWKNVTRRELGLLMGAELIGFIPPSISATEKIIKKNLLGSISVDNFGAIANSEAAASVNKIAFDMALNEALLETKELICESGGTYWLPPETNIGRSGITFDGRGATLKQVGGKQNLNWLLVTVANGFKLKNFVIDGNRINTPNFGADRSLLTVFNTENIDISYMEIKESNGKGLSITSGVIGNGTRRVKVHDVTAHSCRKQCVMTDASNNTILDDPACEDIIFDRIFIKATDHAGIAINDGSRRVAVTNCIAEVNNAVWDAIAIRGSQTVTVSNCIGRRGRNGIQIHVLDARAIARGEDCRDIKLSNNIWELNKQNGCLVAGVEYVEITGDISRNNGQSGVGYCGFNITQVPGVRRSKGITMNSIISIDDQLVHTQSKAIDVTASDGVVINSPTARGNISSNRVTHNSSVKGLSVINESTR